MTWRSTPRSTAATAATRAELSRDWEIWGPNGGYVASIALRAAGAHSRFDRPATLVGHFLGVADFDDRSTSRSRRCARPSAAESIRVSMTQGGQPIFDAMVWAVGDVAGLEHDVTAMPDVPDPETLPSTAERLARAGRRADTSGSGPTSTSASPTGSTTGRTARPRDPVFGHWYRYVPRVDVRRPVGRRVPVADPARHAAAGPPPASCTPRSAVHRAEHRPLGRVPPRPPRRAVAVRAGDARRARPTASSACESRVWAHDGTLLAVGASQLLCRPACALDRSVT